MKEGCKRDKKAQVTIFVILALVILVVGVLIYFYYPKISSNSNSLEENPNLYFQNCVEETFQKNVEAIGLQGGSLDLSNSSKVSYPYILYNGTEVGYLCYTNEPYKKCVIQKVLLVPNIEKELKQSLIKKVNSCLDEMKNDYLKAGYKVNLKKGNFGVTLLPKKILLEDNSTLTLTKESVKRYNSFEVVLNNNLYELVSIARAMVQWEVKFGDNLPIYFMKLYPSLYITKTQLGDGVRIYSIADLKNLKNKFQFASRSMILPLGIPSPTSSSGK